jgi:hypothetical protein
MWKLGSNVNERMVFLWMTTIASGEVANNLCKVQYWIVSTRHPSASGALENVTHQRCKLLGLSITTPIRTNPLWIIPWQAYKVLLEPLAFNYATLALFQLIGAWMTDELFDCWLNTCRAYNRAWIRWVEQGSQNDRRRFLHVRGSFNPTNRDILFAN